MLNKQVVLGWHECNTTHFNLHNIKYNIHLEINFFLHPKKQYIHFKSSTHIQNNIVQQKYYIHIENKFFTLQKKCIHFNPNSK